VANGRRVWHDMLDGTGSITSDGALTIWAVQMFGTATFTNAGTAIWMENPDGLHAYLQGFTNTGSLTLPSGVRLNGTGDVPLLVNTGTITAQATGSADASILLPFQNSGMVNVASRTLYIGAGGESIGTFSTAADARTDFF